MPRVFTRTKNRAGRERSCNRCGNKIEPGQKYRTWSFRYGGTYFRCTDCPAPRPSELTQSIMSEVYAAVENAEDQLPGAESVADIRGLVEEVEQAAQEVADQYREAAEPFGGAGENAERADELEGWVSELQNFDPDEPDEPDEEDEEDDDAEDPLEDARNEATDLINGCPL